MAAATPTAKGQIVVPADVRARNELTASSPGCERFVTAGDRRLARRAKRLRLEPGVSLLR